MEKLSKRKPTREELQAARSKTVEDVISRGLDVLFCGINPGLYTAAIGHHFGRPGNRFWLALHASGFTDKVLSPYEERELLRYGCGITNLVPRTTASEQELKREEIVCGAKTLEEKAMQYTPGFIAVLGIGAYRAAFRNPRASIGRQNEKLGGSIVWVLPNPSGLNAHYQAADLKQAFGELRNAVEEFRRAGRQRTRGSSAGPSL